MLHALDGSHVLRSLEGRRIGASQLAHAALHFRDRLVLVLVHPFVDATFDVPQMGYTVSQESRAKHSHVRPDHQHLDYILRTMHTTRRSQVRLNLAEQDSNP